MSKTTYYICNIASICESKICNHIKPHRHESSCDCGMCDHGCGEPCEIKEKKTKYEMING